ncbi:hypothetical protein CJA_1932 [Cellvibrio japonicus Ueda107]|uniref:Uncharacterized protein n=1 Tax=Cellvibrio japonicus (strain Ueda107) TaxID=498211 RepID=B3PGS9_CELJU|nr:hypothetical protein CJA_1932 [Cellvibrio japonicus Ueda107]
MFFKQKWVLKQKAATAKRQEITARMADMPVAYNVPAQQRPTLQQVGAGKMLKAF